MVRHKQLAQAQTIRLAERDHQLGLDGASWPAAETPLAGWETVPGTSRKDGYHWRLIAPPEGSPTGTPPLWEAIIRLPNAPIYGINRQHDHRVKLDTTSHHTVRLIALGARPPRHIRKIFLLQNGLNEIEKLTFYYAFARHLMASQPGSVCMVTPFPGHITRFPFQAAYAVRPLDRFLEDSGDLFRSFLRHMVEMRWLLSCITQRSQYLLASGATLLAPSLDKAESRLSSKVLAREIASDFAQMQTASRAQLSQAGPTAPTDVGRQLSAPDMGRAIRGLRSVLRLPAEPDDTPESEPDGSPFAPQVHVIGYSLGGFVAQSIFMTWPFAVSSCSTICSGGALRQLAPSAFAHPEEWQTVMHSLRYQLDDAMLEGRITRGPDGTTAGIETPLFGFLSRIFYEIFEQEVRGTYQSHISEYTRRLFFVVGGHDPIVRPQSVLDSAPESGINLLSIANLTHFLGGRPVDGVEHEQREYWIPEVAGMVGRFSEEAATAHGNDIRAGWLKDDDSASPRFPEMTGPYDPDLRSSSFVRPPDGSLASPQFEQYMDLMCHDLQEGKGWLFILRNDIPTALLSPSIVRWRGSALHHADRPIIRYIRGVERRHQKLTLNRNKIVVMPTDIRRHFVGSRSDFPPNSDATVGLLPGELDVVAAWTEFQTTWFDDPRIRLFSPGLLLPDDAVLAKVHATALFNNRRAAQHGLLMNNLPDCWIWMSDSLVYASEGDSPETAVEQFVQMRALNAARKPQRTPTADDVALSDALRDGQLKILAVSGAKYNPRYRGKLVSDLDEAKKILVHAALALMFSRTATAALVEDEITPSPAAGAGRRAARR